MYVATDANATIIAGNALCTCLMSSCSVKVAGIQLGRVLSVKHRDISKNSIAIPTIAIHVRDALDAIGIVRIYVDTTQNKYTAAKPDNNFNVE